jgi:hypothetical protein
LIVTPTLKRLITLSIRKNFFKNRWKRFYEPLSIFINVLNGLYKIFLNSS